MIGVSFLFNSSSVIDISLLDDLPELDFDVITVDVIDSKENKKSSQSVFFNQQKRLEVFILFFFSKELYNTVCAKEVNTPQQ